MFAVTIPRWFNSLFNARNNTNSDETDSGRPPNAEELLALENDPEYKVWKMRFNAAAAFLPHVINEIGSRDLLLFYALYKQATSGDADYNDRPSMLDMKSRSKFDAWFKLRGKTRLDAMVEYTEKLLDLDLGFDPDAAALQTQGFGLRPSRMMAAEDDRAGDANFIVDKQTEPWFNAVKLDDVTNMKLLLADRPELKNVKDVNLGMTALHWAVDTGCSQAFRCLLENHADVNASDNDGNTPLHFAALCSRQEMVELLISNGADISRMNNEKETPYDCCTEPEIHYMLLPK